jgi:hypothetical protein
LLVLAVVRRWCGRLVEALWSVHGFAVAATKHQRYII